MAAAEGFLNPDIWWLYDPVVVPIVERRNGKLLVYDCVDRHSAYGGYRGLLDSLEQRLLSQADLVFVTARGLYDHCAQWAKETHFLPNGFDEDLFNESMDIPARLESIARPRLGFVGGVAHWLDLKLVAAAAKAKPDWSFVFVGPIGDLGTPIPRAPNIHWLGRCRREMVPAYISGFDVGLIPFKESFLTKTVNPLKAYEYLAAGVPVVSTRLPELDHMDLIPQAGGVDDFVAYIENALSDGKGFEMSRNRREAVADYSLQRTMAKMIDIIAEKL